MKRLVEAGFAFGTTDYLTAPHPERGMKNAPVSVAVTGAAGYIGSRVVALLQQEHPDWAITALDDFSGYSNVGVGSALIIQYYRVQT